MSRKVEFTFELLVLDWRSSISVVVDDIKSLPSSVITARLDSVLDFTEDDSSKSLLSIIIASVSSIIASVSSKPGGGNAIGTEPMGSAANSAIAECLRVKTRPKILSINIKKKIIIFNFLTVNFN
jgi:hypothetical protein